MPSSTQPRETTADATSTFPIFLSQLIASASTSSMPSRTQASETTDDATMAPRVVDVGDLLNRPCLDRFCTILHPAQGDDRGCNLRTPNISQPVDRLGFHVFYAVLHPRRARGQTMQQWRSCSPCRRSVESSLLRSALYHPPPSPWRRQRMQPPHSLCCSASRSPRLPPLRFRPAPM